MFSQTSANLVYQVEIFYPPDSAVEDLCFAGSTVKTDKALKVK